MQLASLRAPSSTLMMGEKFIKWNWLGSQNNWCIDFPADADIPATIYHNGYSVNWLLCDGHVQSFGWLEPSHGDRYNPIGMWSVDPAD
jgi:prepilin-type processing-associated H-X9-DG protein